MKLTKPTIRLSKHTDYGARASSVRTFGPFNRYGVYAVYCRNNGIQWFVTDAEQPDEYGHPSVIRQEVDFDDAIAPIVARRHCDDCGRVLNPRYCNDSDCLCSQCNLLPDCD